MRKITIFFLIMIFLLSMSCRASSEGTSAGYIVYTAVDQAGNPLRELVVLDANGNDLRRINLHDIQGSGNISNWYPYIHPSHRVLVYNGGVALYQVDVLSGVVKLVQIPGTGTASSESTSLSLCNSAEPGNNNWTLLCRGNIAYLLNLETAEVYDILPHPPGDQRFPYQIGFSQDITYISINTHDGVFMLPTSKPEAVRQVGKAEKITHIDFSPDNKRIVYVRPVESLGYEVAVEAIDGSQPEVLYTSDQPVQAVFIPGQDQILVVGGENILLLSLAGRIEKEFPAQVGPTMRPIFSPQGGQALVGYHGTEVGTYSWQWLDLKRGIASQLPELEKKYIEFQAYRGQRWLLFSEENILAQGSTVDLVSVDLQTGSLQPFPTLEDADVFSETSATADGEFRTGITHNISENLSEFWMMDLASGKAQRIANDEVANGAVSPDGKKVAVYTGHHEGTQFQRNIKLQDNNGKILKSLGEGYSPFWVWP